MIEITEDKLGTLAENAEKMLRYGGKVMQCKMICTAEADGWANVTTTITAPWATTARSGTMMMAATATENAAIVADIRERYETS